VGFTYALTLHVWAGYDFERQWRALPLGMLDAEMVESETRLCATIRALQFCTSEIYPCFPLTLKRKLSPQ